MPAPGGIATWIRYGLARSVLHQGRHGLEVGQATEAQAEGRLEMWGKSSPPRSDWCCGTPHIQAEDRLMTDQGTEPNVWDDDLCTIEAATPTIEAIVVADSWPSNDDQCGVNPVKCGCG